MDMLCGTADDINPEIKQWKWRSEYKNKMGKKIMSFE